MLQTLWISKQLPSNVYFIAIAHST